VHQLLTAIAGFGVGIVVGLTGMGGGALMTPVLVIFFGIQPGTAVSSDLVASLVMKPIGGLVHARRGTVHPELVRWLCLGSVPSAFLGALLLKSFGNGKALQDRIGTMIGVALLVAALGMVVKATIAKRRLTNSVDDVREVPVRPLVTLAIGIGGGLIVGLTSVGSGSLMLVTLLAVYPQLTAGQLVGTDLVQAVPLVGAAAVGHLLFGHVQFGLTGALVIGAVPGVYLGARISSKAPDHLIRPVLVYVLTLSGLKLLGLSNTGLAVCAVTFAAAGAGGYALMRLRRSSRSTAAPVHQRTDRVAALPD
jgi:uncharacterized membrane protein YfcA